eukprot:2303082-Rhodomonas_salina.4
MRGERGVEREGFRGERGVGREERGAREHAQGFLLGVRFDCEASAWPCRIACDVSARHAWQALGPAEDTFGFQNGERAMYTSDELMMQRCSQH